MAWTMARGQTRRGSIIPTLLRPAFLLVENGAAGATRTPDLVLRRHALYPAELQPRTSFISCTPGCAQGCAQFSRWLIGETIRLIAGVAGITGLHFHSISFNIFGDDFAAANLYLNRKRRPEAAALHDLAACPGAAINGSHF